MKHRSSILHLARTLGRKHHAVRASSPQGLARVSHPVGEDTNDAGCFTRLTRCGSSVWPLKVGDGFWRTTLIALFFLLSGHALADQEVGNGGGAWVCYDCDGLICKVTLVDLYEGREEFKLTIAVENRHLSYQEIVEFKKMKIFSAHREFYEVLIPYIDRVLASLEFVDAELVVIDDALYRIKPSRRECAFVGGETIEYVQLANYTHYGKILICNELWNDPHFSSTDQAALIFHEAVYLYLRENLGDKNSVRARGVVGYLFSSLSPSEMQAGLERVLGKGYCGHPGGQRGGWPATPDPTCGAQGPCGLFGSVEERIRDCHTQKPGVRPSDTWSLATRTRAGKEVWRDDETGLLWSDRLDDQMEFDQAQRACGERRSLEARGGMTDVNWSLPEIGDYKIADGHRVREILPNMAGHWFWSSSVHSEYRDSAWEFYGSNGYVGDGARYYVLSVRCVGR